MNSNVLLSCYCNITIAFHSLVPFVLHLTQFCLESIATCKLLQDDITHSIPREKSPDNDLSSDMQFPRPQYDKT